MSDEAKDTEQKNAAGEDVSTKTDEQRESKQSESTTAEGKEETTESVVLTDAEIDALLDDIPEIELPKSEKMAESKDDMISRADHERALADARKELRETQSEKREAEEEGDTEAVKALSKDVKTLQQQIVKMQEEKQAEREKAEKAKEQESRQKDADTTFEVSLRIARHIDQKLGANEKPLSAILGRSVISPDEIYNAIENKYIRFLRKGGSDSMAQFAKKEALSIADGMLKTVNRNAIASLHKEAGPQSRQEAASAKADSEASDRGTTHAPGGTRQGTKDHKYDFSNPNDRRAHDREIRNQVVARSKALGLYTDDDDPDADPRER